MVPATEKNFIVKTIGLVLLFNAEKVLYGEERNQIERPG